MPSPQAFSGLSTKQNRPLQYLPTRHQGERGSPDPHFRDEGTEMQAVKQLVHGLLLGHGSAGMETRSEDLDNPCSDCLCRSSGAHAHSPLARSRSQTPASLAAVREVTKGLTFSEGSPASAGSEHSHHSRASAAPRTRLTAPRCRLSILLPTPSHQCRTEADANSRSLLSKEFHLD